MTELKKIRSIWESCVDDLKQAEISCAEKTATAIILYVLDMEKEALSSFLDLRLDDKQIDKIKNLIERRKKGEPLPHILGHIIFYGLKIYTESGVAYPVFEVESLIEQTLLLYKKERALRILDLGTGTGCILLALLHALPHATGVGLDINKQALALAEKNSEENGLSDRAVFRLGNWKDDLEERFDLVISNPPAAPTESIPHLHSELRDYDPITAIDGGKNGLSFFKEIVQNFEKLAKLDATGIFHIHDPKREASLFYKAGFPVETKFNRHYRQSGVYLEPCCIVVKNKKQRRTWLQKVVSFLSKSIQSEIVNPPKNT